MSNKKYYMVIDTETCGDYVFDIGYRLIDRKGNCYANGSYVVKEFINDPAKLDMFNDRFTCGTLTKLRAILGLMVSLLMTLQLLTFGTWLCAFLAPIITFVFAWLTVL